MTLSMAAVEVIWTTFGPCAQSYCFSSFANDASRASEVGHHVRVTLTDSLRWGVSAASFLQSAPASEGTDAGGATRPAQQSVQRGRDAARAPVPDDPGARTDRDGAAPAPEWRLPVPDRAQNL